MWLRSGRRHRSSGQQLGSACGGGPDRISALPDDLLLLVLARLRCARLAARTSVLSRRWRGLWCRLRQIIFRDVPFRCLEAALGRVNSSVVSLLEIRVPRQRMSSPDPAGVSSLLNAAVRLAPEEFVFALPGHLNGRPIDINLSCFHRATSIELDSCLLFLRVPAVIDFPALETLSLSGMVQDLDHLLSCCPGLRTLRLGSIAVADGDGLRVNSASLHELVVDRSFKWTRHVNIVAPVLKQLTLSFMASDVTISVVAPMVEKVRWDCSYSSYDRASIVFGLWRLEQVTLQTADRASLQICARASSYVLPGEGDTFAHEIEKHMIAEFSILELHLVTNGHVFGALMFHLLGVMRICSSMKRLKVILKRSQVKEECSFHCPCEPSNRRSQTISLFVLEEMEINGFEGVDHEFDLLKLIFKCAPLLKKMTVKLSRKTSAIAKIYDIFNAYCSVECNVYHNSREYIVCHALSAYT